ncbi:MAG: hypothetical protein PF485_03325, partial [Bacteroidales bacterium]|nr:hypothetical protein [Bacteroidales bacterium]
AKDDYLNKRNRDKIGTYKSLKFYVYKGLLKQWSPEQISGIIKLEYPNNLWIQTTSFQFDKPIY